MKLSADLLLERIQDSQRVLAHGNLGSIPPLGRPLLYEEDASFSKGHFLIAKEEEIQEELFFGEDICLILLCRQEPSHHLEVPHICLKEKGAAASVINDIQHIFDQLEEWKEQMDEIRNRRGSLAEYLHLLQPQLGNPVCVLGTDFSLKESVGLDRLPREPRFFSSAAISMEFVNILKQDPSFNEMQASQNVYLFPRHVTGYRWLNLNLRDKGEYRYRLMVLEADKKLAPGDKYLMECAMPYLCYCVYHEELVLMGENNNLREIFRRILTDRTADYIEISRQLQSSGWSADSNYLCLVFQVTYLDQVNLTIGAICSYMESTYPGACSFPYKEEIVTYFHLPAEQGDVEDLKGKLKYFIRESFLKAGYSWVMQGHGNLRRQYVQAQIALDVGSRTNPYLWIHHFNDVAFSYILEQSAKRLPGYMLCHERLRLLAQTDQQQGTEYMKTLKVYLDEHMNAMQSAKQLFIHRSTFLYRLDKIKHILESDLDDPEEVLFLSFSFRLLEKEQKK